MPVQGGAGRKLVKASPVTLHISFRLRASASPSTSILWHLDCDNPMMWFKDDGSALQRGVDTSSPGCIALVKMRSRCVCLAGSPALVLDGTLAAPGACGSWETAPIKAYDSPLHMKAAREEHSPLQALSQSMAFTEHTPSGWSPAFHAPPPIFKMNQLRLREEHPPTRPPASPLARVTGHHCWAGLR